MLTEITAGEHIRAVNFSEVKYYHAGYLRLLVVKVYSAICMDYDLDYHQFHSHQNKHLKHHIPLSLGRKYLRPA